MSSGFKQQHILRISVWLDRVEKLAAHYEPHDKTVSCQHPHAPVTSCTLFQQVGNRPDC